MKIYERLNLYRVDMKYVRNLHKADDKVWSVSPPIGKEGRVYVSVLIIMDRYMYIVPLSHQKDKHISMKPSADFDKVYDRKGRLVAVLNFNLMIPVKDEQLIPVDLKINEFDDGAIRAYKHLCIEQIEYCRRKDITKIINDKSNQLYRLCTDENSSYKGKNRCVDFKKLEKVCDKYNS